MGPQARPDDPLRRALASQATLAPSSFVPDSYHAGVITSSQRSASSTPRWLAPSAYRQEMTIHDRGQMRPRSAWNRPHPARLLYMGKLCLSRSHPDRLDSSAPSKSPPPRPKKVDRLCGCLPKERRLPTPYPYRGCRSFNRKAQATAAVEWIVGIDCDLKQPLPVGHTDPCLRDMAQIQPLRRHIPPVSRTSTSTTMHT